VIDRFIDALWIEDGLAQLTLAAYRRDLTLLPHWLADRTCRRAALDSSAREPTCWPTSPRATPAAAPPPPTGG
jgi:site-specific recombinase XerD